VPTYQYVCASGHRTGTVRSVDERNDPIPCGRKGCELAALRDISADYRTVGGRVDRPAIPAHFNRSLGRMVYSREHLERLQLERGVQDYSEEFAGEPSRDFDSKDTSWV
jgi:hypothetical protein